MLCEQAPKIATTPLVVDWPRLLQVLKEHQRFLLTTHIRPDCDAIGSELALADVLRQMGREVACVNAFTVPPALQFLDENQELIALWEPRAKEEIDRADILVVLDTTAWAQLGDMGPVIEKFPRKKIVIDHHVSGDDLGAELFKDTQAEATGRIIAELVRRLGLSFTPRLGKLLFAAIATDTGWFRFNSVRAETFELAGELTKAGVAPDKLYRQLFENERLGRFRLMGRAMARAETDLEGRIIHSYILNTDFAETGALSSDTEDIINTTLTVAGTELALMFIEHTPGQFKVSFRSRCHVDCSRLAAMFGGGGHKSAAGATVPGPLDVARARVLDAARRAMQQ
ncbi:bifunctional oligoribonuclease/PAP phosphatase NrnA [Thermogutta sp.]|uniref:DHH family phosphoesterase n=1 Tax=Thermogutta sp. TaxID=1962930 RepID=UPI0032200C66